ncbi:TetR-like C-terminal domain-containing protein [Streptomyces sp. NPDC057445]|uniref:TetR-like C-terminal domain-containing protein n=1 Tax=Streptomyces sp. NPDC057445 TaxID=3346136 RepID=UPI003692958A
MSYLCQLCRRMRAAMFSKSGYALRSVLHECDSSTAERLQALILDGVVEPSNRLVDEVVSRGIERRDVRPDVTGGMLFDAIPAMMMYRSKVCGSEWLDADIAEMIDQIIVPLLRPQAG